jgi:uncharacterized cupin superfamily protein
MDRRHPNVANVEEVTPQEQRKGKLGHRSRRLGTAAGGKALGCSYYEVAPGLTAFPRHFHSLMEEALYILEGSGTLKIGEAQVELRAGDYVGLPAGPETVHALTNSGSQPLRYLAFSAPATPVTADILGYPDSKKIAFASGVDPVKGMRGGAWLMKVVSADAPSLDYFQDEPLAKE